MRGRFEDRYMGDFYRQYFFYSFSLLCFFRSSFYFCARDVMARVGEHVIGLDLSFLGWATTEHSLANLIISFRLDQSLSSLKLCKDF